MNKDLLPLVATELEALRRKTAARFPPLCRYVVKSLPGNQSCVDCGAVAPDWASVTHGSLICLQCSGNHRSYGVHTSVVRSIDMDHWTHDQVLAMLEGGNGQLSLFFERHQMGRDSRAASHRYHTKAGLFYRTHLTAHVVTLSRQGCYRGREANRKRYNNEQTKMNTNSQPKATNNNLSKETSQRQPIVVAQ